MTRTTLPMLRPDHVAIVGGGFSGALLAINLLRHEGPRATLIERRRDRVARGLAYGAAQAEHLLNVRALNMSAFPDEPEHFLGWLARRGVANDDGFVRRSVYGAYLYETLDEAMARTPGRLDIVQDEALDVALASDRIMVKLRRGNALAADVAVLSPGNLPPHAPLQFCGLDGSRFFGDPWVSHIARGLRPDDMVLLVGTGLTAVDVATTLDSAGFTGRIIALSRRGLSPRTHAPTGAMPVPTDPPVARGSSLVRHVRARAGVVGWRVAVDELRPHTQNLWQRATLDERRRFLRHLRPYWDVHRHRLAPSVARRVNRMVDEGRLSFMAGAVEHVAVDGDGAVVRWRGRKSDERHTARVARIINCTGPEGDLLRSEEPLLRSLLNGGLIRPDALHLGIDVNQQCQVIGSDGNPLDRLLAIGPMTRGHFWEIVAVPDLRVQVWDIARRFSASHWVGGEGL